MSTNGDTVIKLSEALSELIEAYEKLQKENDEIKAKNSQLEEELQSIAQEKEDLESNVSQLNQSSEKQESNINSMLGKIESLLGVKNNSKKELKDIVIKEEPKKEEEPTEAQELEENIFNVPLQHEVQEEEIKEESSLDLQVPPSSMEEPNKKNAEDDDDGKLDLNRMASLLNGFNK